MAMRPPVPHHHRGRDIGNLQRGGAPLVSHFIEQRIHRSRRAFARQLAVVMREVLTANPMSSMFENARLIAWIKGRRDEPPSDRQFLAHPRRPFGLGPPHAAHRIASRRAGIDRQPSNCPAALSSGDHLADRVSKLSSVTQLRPI